MSFFSPVLAALNARRKSMPSQYVGATNGPSFVYPDDSETVDAPNIGPTSPVAPSNVFTPSQPQPDINRDVFMPQLENAQSRYQSALDAPHAGLFRQLAGAFVGNRNPQLGGIISGESRRNQDIGAAKGDYDLVSDIISKNRAAQMGDLNALNVKSEIGHRTNQDDTAKALLGIKENPPAKSAEDQTFEDLVSKGMAPEEALNHVKNIKDIASKPTADDKAISDYIEANGLSDSAKNRDKARSALKTRDRAPKDPELTDLTKQLKVAQLEKAKEPTTDEQRRSDLAGNLEENLDKLEDIAKRRPELFGPVAGRMTGARQAFGTSDPDVAALKVIEEQTGLAMVGAHAMRNAQHAEKAAQSITGANHNTADALLAPNGPIANARASVATFKKDASRRREAIDSQTQGTTATPTKSVNAKDPLGILN